MRFLLSLLSFSLLSSSCISASSSSSSSQSYFTLPMSRRHMTIQAALDAAGIHDHHAHVKSSYHSVHSLSATSALSGCSSMDFTTPVSIAGNTYNLIVDTGSSSLAVVSSQCGSSCPTPVYTPGSTATIQSGQTAQSQYGDGSGWTGRVVQDSVSIGGSPAVPVKFATIDQQSNNFFHQGTCADQSSSAWANQGIIGFAYPGLAVSTTNTFFSQLVTTTGIPNYFAMKECLTTGNLYLGGIDTSSYTGLIYYTPIIQQEWYVVKITNMLLGGQTLSGVSASTFVDNSGSGPINGIVDSGTSQIVVPTTVYNAITSKISSSYGSLFSYDIFSSGSCSPLANRMTGTAAFNYLNQNLPNLNIAFGAGFTLNLNAAASYVIPYDSSMSQWCSGIGDGGSSQTILGWGFVNQFVTIYDIANSQIGFAVSAGCTGFASGGTITPGSATGQGAPAGSSSSGGTTTTTVPPTTKAPTTATPTTRAPTTAAPTTRTPTTLPPTTIPPATTAPTTARPSTGAPTTTTAPTATTAPTTRSPTSTPTPTAKSTTTTPPTTTAPTSKVTPTPTTIPTPPNSGTCAANRCGPSCQYYYGTFVVHVKIPYSSIYTSSWNPPFATQFANDITSLCGSANVVSISVLDIEDDGNGISTKITFSIISATYAKLYLAEQNLATALSSTPSTQAQAYQTTSQIDTSSGVVTLSNYGNDGTNSDGQSGDGTSDSKSGLNMTLIGIIIGAMVVAVVLVIVISVCIYRHRQKRAAVEMTSVHIARSTSELPQLSQKSWVTPNTTCDGNSMASIEANPLTLPPGWTQQFTNDRTPYYFNALTSQTQWTRPS